VGGDKLDALDLELNFLEGNPIEIEPNLFVHKVSFSDINKKKIGFVTYNRVINMICLDKSDISDFVTDDTIDVYTFLVLYAYQSIDNKDKNKTLEVTDKKYFIDELISVLQVIFNDVVYFNEDYGIFFIGNNGLSLNKQNFYNFQTIIRKRNCLENIDEELDNPANEMARQILEKRKKIRERLAKAKAKQNNDNAEPLTIADLISIFAEAEHMKLEEVFQYDIFQFNNQFNRMKIFKDYTVNVQALLAGAKSEDIQLQHWLSKIKNE
jgi:hypothetical protein